MTSSFAKKGMLISFEGGEGAGKSTQIQLLAEHFQKAGKKVISLREPGGTPIGEAIRNIVLDPDFKEMAFSTEVFLFQAQRAQLYSQMILPELKKGNIVLIDRSRDSSLIYQGKVRHFGAELIEELNTISTQDTYPNTTFLLDIEPEKGLARRVKSGHQNRLDQEKTEFYHQVRDAYLTVARENKGNRWHIIDADQSPEDISTVIWHIVKEFDQKKL